MTLAIILLGITLYFLWDVRQELADISQRQRQLAASVDHLAGRLDALQSTASAGTTVEAGAAPIAAPPTSSLDEAGAESTEGVITSVEKAASAVLAAEPVNLNTANKSALQTLPRIGRASADNIIAARPFDNVEQLADVAGISAALFEELKGKVTV